MKKQIVAIISKISLAITLVVSMGATQMLFMPATVKAAPAKCYTTIGFLQVEPTTTVCSVDPGGRITYFDLDNVLVPQPEDNACYTGERTGGNDTFQSRRFQEASCVDLETLRTQARRSYCDRKRRRVGPWFRTETTILQMPRHFEIQQYYLCAYCRDCSYRKPR
jgi:hypothetical protein